MHFDENKLIIGHTFYEVQRHINYGEKIYMTDENGVTWSRYNDNFKTFSYHALVLKGTHKHVVDGEVSDKFDLTNEYLFYLNGKPIVLNVDDLDNLFLTEEEAIEEVKMKIELDR
jgi:hypothetical protein